MGYMTEYSLEIISGPEYVRREETCTTCGQSGAVHSPILDEIAKASEEYQYVIANGESKWYEHEAEMRSLSKNYPDTVFKLRGNGESPEDIWVKYFKNGKMQVDVADITLKEFDESELK